MKLSTLITATSLMILCVTATHAELYIDSFGNKYNGGPDTTTMACPEDNFYTCTFAMLGGEYIYPVGTQCQTSVCDCFSWGCHPYPDDCEEGHYNECDGFDENTGFCLQFTCKKCPSETFQTTDTGGSGGTFAAGTTNGPQTVEHAVGISSCYVPADHKYRYKDNFGTYVWDDDCHYN